MAAPAAVGGDVDPIAKADLYLKFGRDAQAEEVLNEAIEKNPNNEEAQPKLRKFTPVVATGLHSKKLRARCTPRLTQARTAQSGGMGFAPRWCEQTI
jgi:Tfp pilus assembly protein FimV